jgi:CRISPR-associated endoribonuclease Cas6
MKTGDTRKFMIASPSEVIIKNLWDHLATLKEKPLHIGDCTFILTEQILVIPSFGTTSLHLISATPILLRIPERNYDLYEITEEERRPRYIFWRPQISFEAFIKQLTENLIKKYNQFYGTEIKSFPLFQEFLFRRMVHTRYIIEGKSYGAAGSMWEFRWNHMNDLQCRIIEFGLDAGFGERNSMGFGFVNIIKD